MFKSWYIKRYKKEDILIFKTMSYHQSCDPSWRIRLVDKEQFVRAH